MSNQMGFYRFDINFARKGNITQEIFSLRLFDFVKWQRIQFAIIIVFYEVIHEPFLNEKQDPFLTE